MSTFGPVYLKKRLKSSKVIMPLETAMVVETIFRIWCNKKEVPFEQEHKTFYQGDIFKNKA